jgi:HAD superfamily hydrolase (TIGR01549 family)
VTALRAVLFDVDFTLCRPGPELGPQGYVTLGREHGVPLDPELYEQARLAAVDDLRQHPELDHDEAVWMRFTEDIVRGMAAAGVADDVVRRIAAEIVKRWEQAAHFELYDDALPVLRLLRGRGLKLGLVSNTSRDLGAFVRHFELDVDAWIASGAYGKVKPSPLIFRAALDLVGCKPSAAVMVGDSPQDDVAGARAVGMRAILLDRGGRYPDALERLDSLAALPAVLGLAV